MGGSDLSESFPDLFYDETECCYTRFCRLYLLELIGLHSLRWL